MKKKQANCKKNKQKANCNKEEKANYKKNKEKKEAKHEEELQD